MKSEKYLKIVETSDIEEVNKLCSEGWYLITTVENKNKTDNETAVIYSFGKKPEYAF